MESKNRKVLLIGNGHLEGKSITMYPDPKPTKPSDPFDF